MSRTQLVPFERLEIVDPLGEIRHQAKQLWKDDGEKENLDWTDYWDQAEREVLFGTRQETPPLCRIKNRGRWSHTVADIRAHPLSESLLSSLKESDNSLLSIVAHSFRRSLDEHECHCLAYVLSLHSIELYSGEILGPLTINEVSELLAEISQEYSEAFLAENQANKAQEITPYTRVKYWEERIELAFQKDEPLTYLQRNTISRLMTTLACHRQVKIIKEKLASAQLG